MASYKQNKKFAIIFATMCFITFTSVHVFVSMTTELKQRVKYIANQSKDRKKKPTKLILIYNTLWGNSLWPGMETTERWNNWGGRPCKIRNCHVTYKRSRLKEADVVLFHAFGSDMISKRKIEKLNRVRNTKSYWIYFVHESPENIIPEPSLYNGFFNWTMSYRLDSDIQVPYNWEWGHWEPRGKEERNLPIRNHAEGKDKLVYAAISHCGCMREHYIKKLKEYIPVDIYGACGKAFNETNRECKRGSNTCEKLINRYKFFLAFENSFCEDYISEKYFGTILKGQNVPVVMGGADYKKIGLPNSFVDVDDFSTIEELANYLKYLDDNDSEYNKYYAYLETFKLGPPRSWSCKICEKINSDSLKPKSYLDLGDWFSKKNQCGTKLTNLRKIMHRSGVPHPYTDEYYRFEDMFY